MSGFPPLPVFPDGIDSDRTLFLVYNTSEAPLTTNNDAWAEEVEIKPRKPGETEIWADNGFASISGELFYYDSVDKDVNGYVKTLKRCVRNIGGPHTQFNLAGTMVRGFVVAEHHNQIVEAVMRIEKFVGINDDTDESTLDWRIRNLRDTPIIFDDFDCPDIDFTFNIIENNPASGILASYTIRVTGDYTDFTLSFGDGSFTKSAAAGTHRYAPNATVDPIVTFSNEKCSVVQSPIERETTDSPTVDDLDQSIDLPVPICPEVGDIFIPSIPIPSQDVIIPPIVFPCVDVSPFPSTILGPISIAADIVNLPSFIDFAPIDIPSLIDFGPVAIPSIIEFGPVDLGPISFPSTIDFGPPPPIGPIDFGPVPQLGPIEFGPPPTLGPIEFGPIPPLGPIEFGPVPPLGPIEFGPVPPIGPVEVSIDPIFVDVDITPVNVDVDVNISPINVFIAPIPILVGIDVAVDWEPVPDLFVYFDDPPIFDPIPFDPPPAFPPIQFANPPPVPINWGNPPAVPVNITVTCNCACCPSTTSPLAMSPEPQFVDAFNPFAPQAASWMEPQEMELNYDFKGFPSVIEFGKVPEMPVVQIVHGLPSKIDLAMPSHTIIEYIGPPIPSIVEIIAPSEPISVVLDIPKSITLDASQVPTSIQLEAPKEFPTLKVDGIPSTIQVVGIPSVLELVHNLPSVIKLEMPENPVVQMIAPAVPMSVIVTLDVMQQQLTEAMKEQLTCVAIVPCPLK